VIVLRIEARGKTTEARVAGSEMALGSDALCAVRREDASWAPVEAWLWHAGTTAVLVRGDGGKPETLRVGDSTKVGHARVTLVGLLPLAGAGPAPGAPPTPSLDLAPDDSPAPGTPKEPVAAGATAAAASGNKPARAFAVRSFEEEMFGSLRRAPWLVLSAAIHAAAGFLLTLLVPASPTPPRPEPLVARFESLSGREDPREHMAHDPEPPLDVPTPDPMDLAEPEPVVFPDADREPPLPAPDPVLEPAERFEAPPPLLGSASALSRRSSAAPPTPPSPALESDETNFDPEQGDAHNRRAAGIVLDDARRRGGSLARVLKGLRPEHILVVRGTFDEMEKTLDALSLPYTFRSPQDVGEGHDYGSHRLVFWGCGEFPARGSRAAIAADLREFVKAGGYLFTSDWMISNVLTEAFPAYLATSGRTRPLPEAILDVRPAEGAERHPLLEGVFLPGTQAKWWLESSSHDVQIRDASRVETLIEAPALATESFGGRSPAVAVTFAYGRGRVLHLLGHYFQKEGNLSGTIAAQRIALNFVRLRLAREDEDVR
jgi:hypothetical protein